MYIYDEIDQRIVDDRVAQFRDQTRRFLAGSLSEDDFRPLRLQNGLYIQRYAPMLRVAIPYGLLAFASIAHARLHRAQMGPRLRPFQHAPEHPVQLAQARRRARNSCQAGDGADARDPDQRQLHTQYHDRSFRRRRAGRNRRSARVVRDHPPVVDVPSGVRLPAAQIQDRGQRRANRTAPRSRCTTSACRRSTTTRATSVSACWSAAVSAARRSSAR